MTILNWLKDNFYLVIVCGALLWGFAYAVVHYSKKEDDLKGWFKVLLHMEFPILMVLVATAFKVQSLDGLAKADRQAILATQVQLVNMLNAMQLKAEDGHDALKDVAQTMQRLDGNVAIVHPLNTTAELFHALNGARNRSREEILLMQVRATPPAKVRQDGSLQYKSDCPELLTWYNGLAQWCLDRNGGGSILRITTDATPEMKAYNEAIDRKMETDGVKNWTSIRLPSLPKWTMVNVCIFDGNEVVLTTAQNDHPQPYSQLKGIYVKDKEFASFLREQYFNPLLVSAGQAGGPAVAEDNRREKATERQ